MTWSVTVAAGCRVEERAPAFAERLPGRAAVCLGPAQGSPAVFGVWHVLCAFTRAVYAGTTAAGLCRRVFRGGCLRGLSPCEGSVVACRFWLVFYVIGSCDFRGRVDLLPLPEKPKLWHLA